MDYEPKTEPIMDYSICGNPCPPDNACDACIEYWHRMRIDGYWRDGEGWTNKGWAMIMERY